MTGMDTSETAVRPATVAPKPDLFEAGAPWFKGLALGIAALCFLAVLYFLAAVEQWRLLFAGLGLLVVQALILGRLGWQFGATRWLQRKLNGIAFSDKGLWWGALPVFISIGLGMVLQMNIFGDKAANGTGVPRITLKQTEGDKALLRMLQGQPEPTLSAPVEIQEDEVEQYKLKDRGFASAFAPNDMSVNFEIIANRRVYTGSGLKNYNEAVQLLGRREFSLAKTKFMLAVSYFEAFSNRAEDNQGNVRYADAVEFVNRARYGLALAQMCWSPATDGKDCIPNWPQALAILQSIKQGESEGNRDAALAWGMFKQNGTNDGDWSKAAYDAGGDARKWANVFTALSGRPLIASAGSNAPADLCPSGKGSTDVANTAIGLCLVRAAVAKPDWENATNQISALPLLIQSEGFLKTSHALREDIKSEISKQLLEISNKPDVNSKVHEAIELLIANKKDLVGWRVSMSARINLLGVAKWFFSFVAFINGLGLWLIARHLTLHRAMQNRIGDFHYRDRRKKHKATEAGPSDGPLRDETAEQQN
jgi:hypothetical protein